ncbi:hypothetical protein ODJ79_18005 [Actinoplanes sp. KI2]|uniref:hypothetical protein n=1 Tax=Actinoplanes sp. KI2 TaxID=2983315 RepID=UPI0021D58B4A|nr:hypothetical protein [Actinoplanes sp. KI2]MCU7725626.1 hypothetical protein [Actinoplanes sp. KI2]
MQYAEKMSIEDTSVDYPSAHVAVDGLSIDVSLQAAAPMPAPSAVARGLFGALLSIYFTQLALARNSSYSGPAIPCEALPHLNRCLAYAMSVRSYREGFAGPRKVSLEFGRTSYNPVSTLRDVSKPQTCLQLVSGGLDSALSLQVIRQNELGCEGIHVEGLNGDSATESSELMGSRRIAETSGIPLHLFRFATTPLSHYQLVGRWTKFPPAFPATNPVPHARETMLVAAAAWLAEAVGGRPAIALGSENSAWSDIFELDGRSYPRWDTQSRLGVRAINDIVRSMGVAMGPLFAPIAGRTEYRKFRELHALQPEYLRDSSFCFWGKNCGVCRKCTRYFLHQRSMKLDLLTFARNPLTGGSDLLVELLNDRGIAYRDLHLAVFEMLQGGSLGRDEQRYAAGLRKVADRVRKEFKEMRSEEMRVREDDSLPAWFDPRARELFS